MQQHEIIDSMIIADLETDQLDLAKAALISFYVQMSSNISLIRGRSWKTKKIFKAWRRDSH